MATLAMPRQDLTQAAPAPRLAEPGMAFRRVTLLFGSCLIAAFVAGVLLQVLGRHGLTVLEGFSVLLSTLLGGWVGFGFISATAGFFVALRDRATAVAPSDVALSGRTAILLPAYNEDPGLVLSAVQAMVEDLRRLKVDGFYDFFILSDTRDDAIARAEATGLLRLRDRLGGQPRVYYRRRVANIDRKAGNIGDWVETYGAAYAYMLVLDADSLMSGETVVALSAAMDRDPRLGLLQTVPTIVNAETPFARLQQFASRLYGPVFAQGQQWWSGNEGNYWGHNAIIRVAAFAQSAGLPHLSGPRPFGGHILSHDFIEAALLRRRGWAVRTLAGLPGSYEETPPTLLDTAMRDRRWCQGNLQHARLLAAAGLHWVSRMHLFRGIFAYLAPAIWLILLVCGAIVWPTQHLTRGSVEYREVIGLFELALILLAAPKVMALILALGAPSERVGFGGRVRLICGVLIESVVSILTTPVMMVMQSVAVIEVLIGRDSGWTPQRREGVELSGRDAWRAHRGHVALGVFGGLGALFVSKDFLMWSSPVFLSLTLSAVLSLHMSRPKAGRALTRRGLFQIPEDQNPPPVLARSLTLRAAYAAEADARRRIDTLFKEPVPVYEVSLRPARQRPLRLVA
jgi:membrane glycosyltransferase